LTRSSRVRSDSFAMLLTGKRAEIIKKRTIAPGGGENNPRPARLFLASFLLVNLA
jgi:hypothetical protein